MRRRSHSEEYRRFRDQLVQARKTAGLSQAELAALLSQPQSFISKYETGERRLDLIEFLEIARVLQVDIVAFISDLQQP